MAAALPSPTRESLRLSPAERRAWDEDGFFVRAGVFAVAELEELRDAAECAAGAAAELLGCAERDYRIDGNRYLEGRGATVQLEHRPGTRTVRVIEPFHPLDARFEGLIDDPRLVEPMRDLVGSEAVSLWTDKLNLKRPREGSGFRWHQDSPYWVFDCGHVDRLPNVMLALDDASEENGCLSVVRGSHRHGILPGLAGEGRLGPLFTDPRFFDATRAVAAELPAGGLLFFSPHAVHGSAPNRSERPRRALVLTYQPAGHRMFKLSRERRARATP